MEKYLIHSNELHLIDAEKIHQAVEKSVELQYLIFEKLSKAENEKKS